MYHAVQHIHDSRVSYRTRGGALNCKLIHDSIQTYSLLGRAYFALLYCGECCIIVLRVSAVCLLEFLDATPPSAWCTYRIVTVSVLIVVSMWQNGPT